jgi:hypothetical protein
LPAVGKEVVELVVGMGTDSREQVTEVGERFDVQTLAGGDQAGKDGSRSPAVVAAVKEPVVPSNHDVTEATLGGTSKSKPIYPKRDFRVEV